MNRRKTYLVMAGVLAVLQNGTVCTAAEDAVLENDPVVIEEGIIIQDEAEDTLLQEEEEEVISQEGFSLPEETEVLNSSEDAADANPQTEAGMTVPFDGDTNGIMMEEEEFRPELPVAVGECGVALEWEISDQGQLFIQGSGAMADYSLENPAPWAAYADSVRSVVIYEGITGIGCYAFTGMEYLESIDIPSTVRDIERGAFRDCSSLKDILVNEANQSYRAERGVLYTADFSELICYPQQLPSREFVVPDQVSEISEYAFYGQDFLQTLVLSSADIMIGDNAFAECTALSDIVMA